MKGFEPMGSIHGPHEKEIEGLSEMLKALANSKRIQILSLLLNQQREFQEIKDVVELGKTALSNHLAKLEELQMITRPVRGTYQLTPLGRTYLNVNTALFRESKYIISSTISPNTEAPSDGIEPPSSPIKVSQPAYFLNAWDSFSGSLAGIFQALGREYDQIDISGYTGIAFSNIFDPTQINDDIRYDLTEWSNIYDILNKLGLRFEIFYEQFPFPSYQGHISQITLEDQARANQLFTQVKKSLETYQKPILLWGLEVPEYGIINGIQNLDYEVHGFQIENGITEFSLRYDSIRTARYMQALFIKDEIYPEHPDIEQITLQYIVSRANGTGLHNDELIGGPQIFSRWKDILMQYPEKKESINMWQNSYLGELFHEKFTFATLFLNRMRQRVENSTVSHFLGLASKEYNIARNLMQEFKVCFPYRIFGPVEVKNPERGAEIMAQIHEHIVIGIKHLEDALTLW